MSSEILFLAIVFIPLVTAVIVIVFQHSDGVGNKVTAPLNYWGSYADTETVALSYKAIPLPQRAHEEIESEAHMHTIGVHP